MSTETCGNRFLTDVGMARAVDQAALMRFDKLLLTAAYEEHGAIKTQEAILADRIGCHDFFRSRHRCSCYRITKIVLQWISLRPVFGSGRGSGWAYPFTSTVRTRNS